MHDTNLHFTCPLNPFSPFIGTWTHVISLSMQAELHHVIIAKMDVFDRLNLVTH